MKDIHNFDLNVLSNTNRELQILNARKEEGNDSVVSELKIYDHSSGHIYYLILNHLDVGPMQLYLLDRSIFARLKRVSPHTSQDFINFINEEAIDVDLDSLDADEIEELPYGKALLAILLLDDSEAVEEYLKNKYLATIDINNDEIEL